mgnify:CR=1 FL=1
MTSHCYDIVDMHQWLSGWGEDGKTLPLVDLRSREEFDNCHLCSSVTIVNLPLSSLLSGERSCELPPRHVEFAILVPSQYAQTFLDGCFSTIHQLFFASQSKSTLQSRKPWLVMQILIEEKSLWKDAGELGLIQRYDRRSSNRDGTFPFQSLPRLWKPDPLVSSVMFPLLKDWIMCRQPTMSSDSQTPINGLVLDLGSGAGRDICYLAEELKEFQQQQPQQCMRSIHFVGIDNHKGSSKRCHPLWKNRGVDDVSDSLLLGLNKLHLVHDHLTDISKLQSQPVPQTTILCIFAIRFLNRKLLSYIAESRSSDEQSTIANPASRIETSKNVHSPPPPLVLPLGTMLAISHFCKPDEGAQWNFDHPKESSVFERWELKTLFEGAKWQIITDTIIPDGDHGRTLVQFVARKVA